MNPKDITEAKDPDLRASGPALGRAAELARRTAIETDTALVVVEKGELLRIPASELRAASTSDSSLPSR